MNQYARQIRATHPTPSNVVVSGGYLNPSSMAMNAALPHDKWNTDRAVQQTNRVHSSTADGPKYYSLQVPVPQVPSNQ
jgi:hypothetical protein